MKTKSLDSNRIENLKYIYGKTSLYEDIITKFQLKRNIHTKESISIANHFSQERSLKLPFFKKKNKQIIRIPENERIKIHYEKKLISGIKTKIEFHYHDNELFFVHVVYSYLTGVMINNMVDNYVKKYLEKTSAFDYQKHNIIDPDGRLMSFCNIYNYSIEDFSVDFIIDKNEFPV